MSIGLNSTVHSVLEDYRAIARLPLTRSVTALAAAYTSEEFFAWEREHVFSREWLCVAHVSQLARPGQFVALDVLGEPLIVVRGEDQRVRVLSRVCPHRGMDIMPEGFGYSGFDSRTAATPCEPTRLLVCPYHHWSFELDGTLKGCAQMQRADGFTRGDFRLQAFRSEVWQGFVFIDFSGVAQPLAEQYANLTPQVAAWNLAEMQVVIDLEWDCPFNWKVMIENWMESYHHLGIHHTTLQPFMPAKDTWTEAEHAHTMRSHLPLRPELAANLRQAFAAGEYAGFVPVPGLTPQQQGEWVLHVGFPCFMFLVTADRALWYRLQPESAQRCRLRTTTLVTRAALDHPSYPAALARETEMLREFHREDMQVCTGTQRGISARAYRRGRLSHLEMPVWLLQRYIAARADDTWPTLHLPGAPGQRGG